MLVQTNTSSSFLPFSLKIFTPGKHFSLHHQQQQQQKKPSMAHFKSLFPVSASLPLIILLHLLSFSISVSSHGGSHDNDEDASPESSSLRSKGLILVKVWCLIIVFVGTFAGGISPYFLKWNEGFLILGTQFAGGVFLGTALMHFLSDSAETFGDLTHVEYPFAFMLACAGYLMTMMADCVISHVYAKKSEGRRGDAENGGSLSKFPCSLQ